MALRIDLTLVSQYANMSTDELLRLWDSRPSLTTVAQQALLEELRRRDLDGEASIAKYRSDEKRHERLLTTENQQRRMSSSFSYLKEHPILALVVSLGCPSLSFAVIYGIVAPQIGLSRLPHILFSLMLVIGCMAATALMRSTTRLPIRIFALLLSVTEGALALLFAFGATVASG